MEKLIIFLVFVVFIKLFVKFLLPPCVRVFVCEVEV